MNILFINKDKVLPNNGGTERATYTVGKILRKNYNHKIYSMYMYPNNEVFDDNLFEDEYLFKRKSLTSEIAQYVDYHHINVIIIQGYFDLVYDIYLGVKTKKIKLYFVHHFEPGFELHLHKYKDYYDRMINSKGLSKFKNIVHCLLFPYYKIRYNKEMHKLYKIAYKYSDNVILLSEKFIKGFMSFGNINEDKKFQVIHNILTFDEEYSIESLENKQKKLLVVSRMDEVPKRISYIIKIWKGCVKNPIFDDWSLDIVGNGPSLGYYKYIVEKEKIPRVTFYGRQNPINFYINSSIFLMTSSSEGWGLTLTEAQYYGVIPIAMDTYLSLHDIITDGIDGYIINNNDFKSYINCLTYLANDKQKRIDIARNCIKNVSKFSSIHLGEKWEKLLLK